MAVLFMNLKEEQLKMYIDLVRSAGKWISPPPGQKVKMRNDAPQEKEALYVVNGVAEFEYNHGEIRGKIGGGLEHHAVLVSGAKEVAWTTELAGTKVTNIQGSEAVNAVLLVPTS